MTGALNNRDDRAVTVHTPDGIVSGCRPEKPASKRVGAAESS
jgi:hypothetical protein